MLDFFIEELLQKFYVFIDIKVLLEVLHCASFIVSLYAKNVIFPLQEEEGVLFRDGFSNLSARPI